MEISQIEFGTLQPHELEHWFDHVAGVFSPRAPRSYFVDHWQNDPDSDLDTIFVARTTTNGQIVATVRVFKRSIYINGIPVPAGAIGEVSTKPEWRQKGLATKLLNMAVEWMRSHRVPVSILLTGEQATFYSKIGWINTLTKYALLDLEMSYGEVNETDTHDVFSCTKVDLNVNHHVRAVLADMHKRYCENQKVTGAIARHLSYWEKWIPTETLRHNAGGMIIATRPGEQDPCAFMIAHFFNDTKTNTTVLRVKEFIPHTQELIRDGGRSAFAALIKYHLSSLNYEKGNTVPVKISAQHADLMKLRSDDVITAVLDTQQIRMTVRSYQLVEEGGIMYRIIDSSNFGNAVNKQFTSDAEALQWLKESSENSQIFFGTDKF